MDFLLASERRSKLCGSGLFLASIKGPSSALATLTSSLICLPITANTSQPISTRTCGFSTTDRSVVLDVAQLNSRSDAFSHQMWDGSANHVRQTPLFNSEYTRKVQFVRKKQFGGTIQGGMSCGLATNLARRYGQFADLIAQGMIELSYGSDQFAFNWLYDPELDSAAGHLWNCIGADTVFDGGVWYSKRYGKREQVIAMHVVGMLRSDAGRLFRNRYAEIYFTQLASMGLVGEPCVQLPAWPAYNNAEVWSSLASVILTCRKHRGTAIAVGAASPRATFTDIGCTNLVSRFSMDMFTTGTRSVCHASRISRTRKNSSFPLKRSIRLPMYRSTALGNCAIALNATGSTSC